MKTFVKFCFLSVVLAVSIGMVAYAQTVIVRSVNFHWERMNDTQDWLMADSQYYGGYDHVRDEFRRWYPGDLWGPASTPPIRPRYRPDVWEHMKNQPCGPPDGVVPAAPQKQEKLPTGVIRDQLATGERFTHNGRSVDRQELIQLIEAKVDQSNIKDDSHKDILMAQSADPKKREAFVKVFNSDPAFSVIRQKATCWECAPDDWSLDVGHVKGEGVVTLTRFDGQILARVQVKDIANANEIVGEIRKVNPNYDPNKDPTPVNPTPSPAIPGMGNVKPMNVAVLGALAVAAYFFVRKKG